MAQPGSSFLRTQAGRGIASALHLAARDVGPAELARPAIVFAPHPDDETLGCGGTIIKKLAAGADVRVAFLTDGRTSHARLMPPEKLSAIRMDEARVAMEALGLPSDNVSFLKLPSSRLAENAEPAREKVAELLSRHDPAQVFVPYRRETLADHLAANRAVLSAVRSCGRKVSVYEYPIWFWTHWPWMKLPPAGRRAIPGRLRSNVLASLRLLKDFRWRVYIADVLDKKRAALDRYASQMTRLLPDRRWTTLGDVAGGEFLERFFQEHEIFRRYTCGARA